MSTQSLTDDGETDDDISPAFRDRSVKDPVHDYIVLHSRSWAFVDTRQFQRLRAIKQLGTAYYVWPGASHNRFEHCLGVAYLARLQVEHLQRNQPELNISERDVECVELAGLCHDLGHGPWSHVWDSLFIPVVFPDKKWTHEDASKMMFDYLREENGIHMNDQDATFVKALIDGDPTRCSPTEKQFLFEIVANKRNGIDVDRLDYIARDSHGIGEKINISSSRIIRSARVIDNQICYDIKDANQIYEIFYTRFSLFKRIYNHKTSHAIEYMVIDALLLAEPFLKIADQVHRPEKYVFLTDDIMPRIESSTEPELAASRALFARIRSRDLYKCVDYKVLAWHLRNPLKEYITSERIVEAAKAWATSNGDATVISNAGSLKASDVVVNMTVMHYGMQEKNPMESVTFYSKHHPNRCAHAGAGDISTLMPAVFGEVLMRVYTRQAKYFGIVQAGYRQVLQSMPDAPLRTPQADGDLSLPATAPSTPKMSSRNVSVSDATASPRSSMSAFRNNSFTTVPPNFAPPSPPHKVRGEEQRTEGLSSEGLKSGVESGLIIKGKKRKRRN